MAEKIIKILLVESDYESTSNMMSIFKTAESALYKLFHVSDLKKAFDALTSETFDVILLNLKLPDSSGIETLTKIRPQLGSTVVIVINGPDNEKLCSQVLNNGATDYLEESECKKNVLFRSIRKGIERSKWKGFSSAFQQEIKSFKIGAIRDATENMVEDLQPNIEEIHLKIGSLKDDMIDKGIFTDKSKTLLDSAEEAVRNLKDAVVDLVQFAKELGPHCSTPLGRSHHRILVVEDEPQVSDVIVNRLKRLKEDRIDVANNGQDAFNMCLDSFREGIPYSMVISDWKMPRMSGAELLEKLRKNPFYRQIPFMMISAVDDREEIKEVAALKVSQYLLKPFTKEDFDKHFKRLLYHV